MNIQNRLSRIEDKMPKPKDDQIVWDFSKTSDEQLTKLHDLIKANNAENYTKQLIDGGFLSYRIIGG